MRIETGPCWNITASFYQAVSMMSCDGRHDSSAQILRGLERDTFAYATLDISGDHKGKLH